MLRRTTSFIALAAALLAGGCSESANAPLDVEASSLVAGLSGAVNGQYSGESHFILGQPETRGTEFSLSSRRTAGNQVESFLIWGYGGMPAVGTYEIGLPGSAPFHLVYTRGVVGSPEQIAYVADGGELVITTSSDRRVEGHFEFDALRYCRITSDYAMEGPCIPPTEPIAGAPRIAGQGTFSAVSIYDVPIGEEFKRGTIKFYYSPTVIETQQITSSGLLRIRVHTYGGGCTSKGRTDVRVEGRTIIVEPIDRHALQRACTDNLVTIVHEVDVQTAGPGNYIVRVIGRQEPGDVTVTVERTVTVD